MNYHVQADWDADAAVWISSSNIPGLVVEAATLSEFVDLIQVLALDLLAENVGLSGSVPVELRAQGVLDLAIAV